MFYSHLGSAEKMIDAQTVSEFLYCIVTSITRCSNIASSVEMSPLLSGPFIKVVQLHMPLTVSVFFV